MIGEITMQERYWLSKAIFSFAIAAVMMMGSAKHARADSVPVFTMTFEFWPEPRTFHVTSSPTPESIEGYSDFFCVSTGDFSCSPLLDPTIFIDLGGDPAPFKGSADVNIPPDIKEFVNMGPPT